MINLPVVFLSSFLTFLCFYIHFSIGSIWFPVQKILLALQFHHLLLFFYSNSSVCLALSLIFIWPFLFPFLFSSHFFEQAFLILTFFSLQFTFCIVKKLHPFIPPLLSSPAHHHCVAVTFSDSTTTPLLLDYPSVVLSFSSSVYWIKNNVGGMFPRRKAYLSSKGRCRLYWMMVFLLMTMFFHLLELSSCVVKFLKNEQKVKPSK